MTVLHINTPELVIANWDIFREGLECIIRMSDDAFDPDEYCKMLINLSVRPDAWIGLAVQGGPLSYGVAVESTPPHSTKRTFTVVSFYAMPGRPDATEALMREFESWARAQGVHSYIATTRRNTGAVVKCFRSRRYGFQKSYIAFEKTL